MAWKSASPSSTKRCLSDLLEGKVALAGAPSHALPEEIVARAKTGFGVPTGAWARDTSAVGGSKGLTSRGWSQFVVRSAGTACDKWLAVSH